MELIDKDLFSHLSPEKVFSSPQKRARQTAEILFGKYEVIEYIAEVRRPYSLIGKNRDDTKDFRIWEFEQMKRDPNFSYEGSESFNDIKHRVGLLRHFLEELDHQDVAIVGHGLFFRHFLGYHDHNEAYDMHKFEKDYLPIKWPNLMMKEIEV